MVLKTAGSRIENVLITVVTNNFRIKEKHGLKISREAKVNLFLENKCYSYSGQVICNQQLYFVKHGVFMKKT